MTKAVARYCSSFYYENVYASFTISIFHGIPSGCECIVSKALILRIWGYKLYPWVV